MALLHKNAFKRVTKERNYIHEPVDATYTAFEKEGQTLFQIDTYGKSDREIPGKVSQSIQIDRKMAETLIAEFQKAFQLK